MLRGRHRGLPVAIDKAVLLPDATLAWAEEEDAQKRTMTKKRTTDLGLRCNTTRNMEATDIDIGYMA